MVVKTTEGGVRTSAKSLFQGDIKSLCAMDNAYEIFLSKYVKLVTSTKTRDETIVNLIETKCTNIYVPLVLSKPIYKTNAVIESIARLNPKLEGFDEDQKNLYFEKTGPRQHTTYGFIAVAIGSIKEHPERKKEDYTEFICTTMHYNVELKLEIQRFANYTTFLQILDCWIKEYSTIGKIFDNNYKSYLSLVKDVLPEYQEKALEKLMSVVIISPKHAIFEPWGEKQYDNIFNVIPYVQHTDLTSYLYRNGEIISYIDSIASLIMHFLIKQPNSKILQYIANNLPFKKNSKFVEIVYDIDGIEKYKRFEKHLFSADLWYNAKSVKQFLEMYYTYKIKPTRFYIKNDTLINDINKETSLGMDFTHFLDKELFPVHHIAITKRTIKDILDEWNLHTDDYIKLINSVDKFGLTPIAYAIVFQNKAAIKFLTTTSASTLKKTQTIGKARIDYTVSISVLKDGFTIEDLIKVYGKEEIGQFFETKKNIEARWKTNVINGYHQTNSAVADIISNTPSNEFWFLAGTGGMYGAGIYFAQTPEETDYKALKHGTILEAELLLGNPLNLRNFAERDVFVLKYGKLHVDLLHHTLQRNGYDSVIALKDERSEIRNRFMQSGNEYMVYNTEQAIFKRIVPRQRGVQLGGTNSSPRISLPSWLSAVQTGDIATLKKLPKSAYDTNWLLNSTPLMVACARGHVDIVKWLLENIKANINVKDSMNRNAIFYAMRGGKEDIVRYLSTRNIDLLYKDSNDKYAIEYFDTKPLEKQIDIQSATRKSNSISVAYREVLLKAMIRIGDPAMEAVFRFYRNTMSPMPDDIKAKLISYFYAKYRTSSQTVNEPWMGVVPRRSSSSVFAVGGKKLLPKKR